MNIKVCGITSLKQLQQLDGIGIDYAGLIFYEKSPRYVVGKIQPAEVKNADFDLTLTGVFVNPTVSDVVEAIDNYDIAAVQLHGDESPEFCADIMEEADVIKAFSIDENTDIEKLIAPYDDACDFYLFDTATAGARGGSGKKFNWQMLSGLKIEKPFFLSGGIGPEDIAAIQQFSHFDFFGIDVNSKFEIEPGIKNMPEILKLYKALQ